ncbi:hypothetical protein BCR32DRAFT_327610 [Anaeromyces robustus]|uniref:Uncharacterized protein n=1 Tax=Anaeromyces robustus TaxID=1754192 RepID=A0A1Y1X4I3_9FUNG|nr:hypothetical protein BCR32DRAFT_327610 [Anaeromyces robustus]|eukprot:ORX80693.1 hypothetical protein BCR32DRAFT_327610 [Anaeromyces robustus]
MKFSTVLLSLLAVTSSLSVRIRYDKKCRFEMDNYRECTSNEGASFEEFKITFNSEKCKKFFEKPLEVLPSCNETLSDLEKNYHISNIKASQATGILYTVKDEKNQECPLLKSSSIESVKQTCNSKLCTKASVEAYTLLCESDKLDNTISEENAKFKESILNVLKQCQTGVKLDDNILANITQADTPANDVVSEQKSDAESIKKIGISALLISLSALFF